MDGYGYGRSKSKQNLETNEKGLDRCLERAFWDSPDIKILDISDPDLKNLDPRSQEISCFGDKNPKIQINSLTDFDNLDEVM